MVTLVQLQVLDAVRRLGSVTAAAQDLHYAQPSVSHHLSRLETDLGIRVIQRVGRGIRLTEAGTLLADRAAEIIGRVESATTEVSAMVGLRAGRVRLAGFGSVMSSLVPQAVSRLGAEHPGLDIELTDTHPEEALQMLHAGEIDVAVIFRYADTATEEPGVRLTHLLDDPLYLLSTGGGTTLKAHRESTWIAGCVRCRAHLEEMCEDAGFAPAFSYTTDDMVVMQELVAAGMGVTTIPGLALRAHRHPDVTVTRLRTPSRQIHAATYGEPPDPPATLALLDALRRTARDVRSRA